MEVRIASVGLWGPGLAGWTVESRAALAGVCAYQAGDLSDFAPVPLPRNAARRAGFSVRLALQAATEAVRDRGSSDLATVFACSGGDSQALDKILTALTLADKPVSPNLFNNSVHNAAAGYWSIMSGSKAPSISLSAYDGSFAAGLLEAASSVSVWRRPVLLVAYDMPPPPPLQPLRRVTEPFALALLLQPEGGIYRLSLALALAVQAQAETCMGDAGLEALRVANPAARCLPLLGVLAQARAGRVVLPYLDDNRLNLDVAPC